MGSPLIFLAKQAVILCIVEITGNGMMGRRSENEGNSGWPIGQQHGKEYVDGRVGWSRRPTGDMFEMFTSDDAEF